MNYEIILKQDLESISWSGGISTELYIYPLNSNFKKRDFCFRLSTATVEVDKSEFTSLPAVSRTLLVMDGNMKLEHKDHHSSNLGKFDQDQFQGNWQTISYGQCIDVNLMTLGQCSGVLLGAKIGIVSSVFDELKDITLVYAYQNAVSVKLEKEIVSVEQGSVLLIENLNVITVESNGESEVVLCTVSVTG